MPSPTRRRRPAPLRATVVRTSSLTPRLTRVTVTGDDFDRFRWPGPAAHFKLLLPEPGAPDVVLPEADAAGTVDYAGGPIPTMRTYTARSFDPRTRELDIDIVLHGEGPAATWARQVRPGERVAVSVPRSAGFVQDPDADWVVLAGDASALPALATITPTLTKPTTVLVEIADVADRIDIGSPVQWLPGTDRGPAVGEALERAIRAFPRPPGRGQVWVAAEAGCIRRIRADLLTELDRDQVTTRGYWRAGEQNHPDHDYGDDA